MTSALHIVGKIGTTSFGLGAVALNLVHWQVQQACDARIWCIDEPSGMSWASETSGIERTRITGFTTSGSEFLSYSPGMERAARETASSSAPQVVHQHSIWTGLSRVTLEWRKRRIPTVVAAQGALQPWALRKSGWKKKMAGFAYESRNLRGAACLHACGENEIGDYREFSLKNPIALMPNAISDSWLDSVGDGARFRAEHGIAKESKLLLYLSRITPKKGLPMLLEAMAALKEQMEAWVLLVAGMDEFGHKAELVQQIRKLGMEKKVVFAGPQHDQAKRDAYAAADLFVLPTHSEGNPLVVLEALGAGCPVLTTKGAPWKDLERNHCGWWCEISTAGIYDALQEAVKLKSSQLAEAGERGKALVRSKYNWKEIASKTILLYDWIAGRGTRPEFVSTI